MSNEIDHSLGLSSSREARRETVRGREDTEANEGVAECATHAGLRL
jgi:hypothetical protein